ncbi:MAG: alanine racemase [Clostridia bacterium]|nr:alanine racemase [Clostridia bacterium]
MPVKAYVDIKNIIYNAKQIKKRLPEGVKFCAVVKADAYGHGAEKVSDAVYNIVDCFAVATVAEGVKLRLCGTDKDILVLTKVFNDELVRAADYSLTLTASDVSDLKRYAAEGARRGVPVKVHIKYDTGMNRQGVKGERALKAALSFCKKSKGLDLCGLYSHFARPEDDKSRKAALDKFSVARKLVKEYNNGITCHISASGGFLKGEYADMVRIGILLYGYKPFDTDAIKVKPAMKVYAPIVMRRTLKRGDQALYGNKRATKETDFALIRYGYADGLFRKEIKGQFNNRCMDLTAATGVSKTARRVAVMENADVLAGEYGTIPYEILVKCTLRAEKIYVY